MIELFRIHGAAYDAFDTMGTVLFGGRWNSRGVPVVYTAQHISLAALEVLVHAGGKKIPPKVLTRILVPQNIEIGEASSLDFAAAPRFGDRWIAESRTAVLRVPSITVNGLEFNYLLNPLHPDFPRITRKTPIPFQFDDRFFSHR